MKLPRDLSGADLAKALSRVGYTISRQTGSHIRLTADFPRRHHVTIPAHESLRVGTLSRIIGEVAGTVAAMETAFTAYRFDEAANAIYSFAWDRFCDWYLELIKGAIDDETKAVAGWVLDQILVSSGLNIADPFFDPVHINAEFADQQSDHDPSVTLIDFDDVWTFSGFMQPVDNPPVLNSVRAGQAVPVKFRLGGDRGLDVLATGSPTSATIPCAGGAPKDPIEETATAGASDLQYDVATQTYTYVWKTQKAWSGTCRRFTLRLDDGTVRTADFRFN